MIRRWIACTRRAWSKRNQPVPGAMTEMDMYLLMRNQIQRGRRFY